jgi:hypothetical protein
MGYRSLRTKPRWPAVVVGSIIVAIFVYIFDPPAWLALQVPGIVVSQYSSINTKSTHDQWLVRLGNGVEVLATSQKNPNAVFVSGSIVRVTAFDSLVFRNRSYILEPVK